MRTVFRFSKGGATRYISHLDLMRTMNRAIRRAGLPAKYSQGFHPHIVMSYAQALGVGYLSTGEYMEIDLDDSIALQDAIIALNTVMPVGIEMTGAWQLTEEFPTLMAAVSAARWLVEFDEPVDEAMLGKFTSLLHQETIEVVKEGRNGPAKVDIRPGIIPPIGLRAIPPLIRGVGDCGSIQRSENPQVRNPPYKGGGRESAAGGLFTGIELLLAAGSKLNIRPELVVKAALGNAEAVKAIIRLELYTFVNGRHTPLYKICIGGDFDERGENHFS
jgi:radical SAM-linked protein